MIYIVTVGKTAYSKTERKDVEVDALNVTDAMLIARKQNPVYTCSKSRRRRMRHDLPGRASLRGPCPGRLLCVGDIREVER